MAAHDYNNGHARTYSEARQRWEFDDPDAQHDVCPHCGRKRTPEGYDACLGHIDGASSACCGHGVDPGYIVWADGTHEALPMLT